MTEQEMSEAQARLDAITWYVGSPRFTSDDVTFIEAAPDDLRKALAALRRVSDLRKRIIEEIPDEDETMSTSTLADAVLAVITAHLTVTEADAIEMWNALDRAHGVPENDAMKTALEAFVASKLPKAETP